MSNFRVGSGGNDDLWTGNVTVPLGLTANADDLIVVVSRYPIGAPYSEFADMTGASEHLEPDVGGEGFNAMSVHCKPAVGGETDIEMVTKDSGVSPRTIFACAFLISGATGLDGTPVFAHSTPVTALAPGVPVANDGSNVVYAFLKGDDSGSAPTVGTHVYDAVGYDLVDLAADTGTSPDCSLTNQFTNTISVSIAFLPDGSEPAPDPIPTSTGTVRNYALGEFTTSAGAVDVTALEQEIVDDATIPIQVLGVTKTPVYVSIQFQTALSAAQQTAMTALVQAHTAEPLPGTEGTAEDGSALVTLSGPRDSVDNKPVVMLNPATDGMQTWLSGRGDDSAQGAAGRGLGSQILVEPSGIGTEEAEWGYNEPVELHDGSLSWSDNFDASDEFDILIRLPATTAAVNGGNVGNVTEEDVPGTGGAVKRYIPAQGDGTHDISISNYDEVIPVPTPGGGAWSVDHMTGEISAAPGGVGDWSLLDTEQIIYCATGIPMLHADRSFSIRSYVKQWIHQAWKMKLIVRKASANAGTVAGWLRIFRVHTSRS